MRKLIMWNLITLDGYFEGESSWDLSFHETAWGRELEEFSIEQLKSAGMLVFGERTYLGMADYWMNAGEPEKEIVAFMNSLPKIVCSGKLESTAWNNTRIVRDAVRELSALKGEDGGDMFVFGSGELSDSLIKAGLFDEYRLCIAPVISGAGNSLFRKGIPLQKLKIIESRTLETGAVVLRYSAV